MITTNNCSALIGGADFINKNDGDKMADEVNKKYINSSSLPYQIGGSPVIPGEIFQAKANVNILQLVGSGEAVEVTKENEKDLVAKYAVNREIYLESQKPKKKEPK